MSGFQISILTLSSEAFELTKIPACIQVRPFYTSINFCKFCENVTGCKDALLSNQQENDQKSGHSKQSYKTTRPQHDHHTVAYITFAVILSGSMSVSQTSISTSSCSFWVKPLTPFPAEAWPIKVMTLISGAWRFSIAAISCTLSRNDENIITRVLTSCEPQSGNASEE